MPRFDRVWSLVIGQGGQSGVEITNPMRVTFDINKDDSKNPNRSRIRVFNLSNETRERLRKPDVRCIFKAGYGEEDGPQEVYQGDVTFVFDRKEGPNIITEIQLGEGAKAIRDIMVTLSYEKDVNSKKILQDLASKLKMSLNMPNDVPARNWQNGLAYHGAARVALDKVCAATGLSWSVQRGALQIIRSGGNTNRTVYDIATDSGLVGSPERLRKGSQEVITDEDDPKKKAEKEKQRSRQFVTAEQEEDGWRIRSLLLPTLVPGDRVKVSSISVNGVFTIREHRLVGDTYGSDWISELRIIEPKAAQTDTRDQRPQPRTVVRQSNVGGRLPTPPPDPGPVPPLADLPLPPPVPPLP